MAFDNIYNPFDWSNLQAPQQVGSTTQLMWDKGLGQQGGSADLTSLLGMLKGPNPLVSAGISAGGALLGGLAGLFKGESWGDKQAKNLYNMAQNRMGQSVLQPEQYLAEYMRSQAPRWNQQGEAIGRRLNLDSGVAQGEMINAQQPTIANFMLQAKQRGDELKFQNDNMLLSLMAQLTGGR